MLQDKVAVVFFVAVSLYCFSLSIGSFVSAHNNCEDMMHDDPAAVDDDAVTNHCKSFSTSACFYGLGGISVIFAAIMVNNNSLRIFLTLITLICIVIGATSKVGGDAEVYCSQYGDKVDDDFTKFDCEVSRSCTIIGALAVAAGIVTIFLGSVPSLKPQTLGMFFVAAGLYLTVLTYQDLYLGHKGCETDDDTVKDVNPTACTGFSTGAAWFIFGSCLSLSIGAAAMTGPLWWGPSALPQDKARVGRIVLNIFWTGLFAVFGCLLASYGSSSATLAVQFCENLNDDGISNILKTFGGIDPETFCKGFKPSSAMAIIGAAVSLSGALSGTVYSLFHGSSMSSSSSSGGHAGGRSISFESAVKPEIELEATSFGKLIRYRHVCVFLVFGAQMAYETGISSTLSQNACDNPSNFDDDHVTTECSGYEAQAIVASIGLFVSLVGAVLAGMQDPLMLGSHLDDDDDDHNGDAINAYNGKNKDLLNPLMGKGDDKQRA